MKILIVSTSDIQGGAARAAYRLHKSLLAQDIDSQMLVANKTSDDYTVITQEKRWKKYFNILRAIVDNLAVKLYKNKTNTFFSPSSIGFSNIIKKINDINPDIVHLHWVCGAMIKIEDIARIKVPIVWSLHDMWAFTGGCHYDEECKGYEKECGECKVLGSDKENDLSKKIFLRKQKTFELKKDITIIGLSKWLNNCSKTSTLFKNKKHINLPNPINTNIFKQIDKTNSRDLWNLPQDKKLILFGAMNATSDTRKGFKELQRALENLTCQDIELVIFGSGKPENEPDFGFKVHYLGQIYDDVSLVALYSAVDVMLVPSLQENLSNAILESMACATPVVGFEIGGNSDLIEHYKNGYLAKPFDTQDLSHGIEWVLNTSDYNELCKNAREKVVREFDSVVVAKKYIKLYEEVLA